MRIKYIYISLIAAFYFFNLSPQSAFPQYQRSYFEKDHQIDISYSVKKRSLTQDYEIVINNNGDMFLLQKDNYSDKPIVFNGKLSKGELEGLKEFIVSANIFNFDNEYLLDKGFIALDSERLRITMDGKTKDILISSSSVPPELAAIINAIKKYRTRLVKTNADGL
ncbi:MAG: hypothetical protein WCY05_05355 [Candidatus Omnitrophota bacterium]